MSVLSASPRSPGTPPTGPDAVRTPAGGATWLGRLLEDPARWERLTHVTEIPGRPGRTTEWPSWAPPRLIDALDRRGCPAPWEHQVEAAELAHQGRSVIVATGTGSGKSLAFLLPTLSMLLTAGEKGVGLRGSSGTVLYLAPTKALAADQVRAVSALDLPVHAATFDGDTGTEERTLVRSAATYVLTNPDMLHAGMLPGHARWADFFRRLRYVVLDECHSYRGVFGSHVAAVLRRLRRICAHYGADPAFLLASATVAEPSVSAERLTGLATRAVTRDTSPHGARTVAFWEPPLLDTGNRQPVRRTATAETAELLADLTADGARSLAFVRSRKGAEIVATSARRRLAEVAGPGGDSPTANSFSDPFSLPGSGVGLPERVAAYRAGYLPEERRRLEHALRSGRLLALATTNALELGVDIVGLDAVLIAGWPGTRTSLWQQAGRAGRAGGDALVVLVGRDDPLDTYLMHHPEAVFGQPVEATVFDAENPYVLAPHLCAAAAELPLTPQDLPLFGAAAEAVADALVGRGALRRRAAGWFWTRRDRACALADLRGSGGAPVRIVEEGTGRLLGTVDPGTAPASVHDGAVYVHQGETYLTRRLDLDAGVAVVAPAEPDFFTSARSTTDIRIVETSATTEWGEATVSLGSVEVTSQVVGFLRLSRQTGQVLSEEPLDLPPQLLHTRAVWWTVSPQQLLDAGLATADVPGAAHAAEHASIGLLPLFATCDRWDIGGVSTALHPGTGRMSVFVYDGAPGGAGFAARAFGAARQWLTATRDAIAACGCPAGCPSCVQSPKCGDGNEPLSKDGALRLLDALLAADVTSA